MMKKALIQRLQITPEQYSDMIFNVWFQWSASKTINQTSLQKVLICQPLQNWWLRELHKLEAQFMEASAPYASTMTRNDALILWAEHTEAIYNRFSKPLIKKAHERKTIEQQN